MAEVDGYESKLQYKQVDGADIVVNLRWSPRGRGWGSGAACTTLCAGVSKRWVYTTGKCGCHGGYDGEFGAFRLAHQLIGLSKDIEITGTTLHGSTDSNGVISFQMIESLKYKITISKDGYDTQTAYIIHRQPILF